MPADNRSFVTDRAPRVCDQRDHQEIGEIGQCKPFSRLDYNPEGAIRWVVLAVVFLMMAGVTGYVLYVRIVDPYVAPALQ